MMMLENIRIALVELWANRARSFLAMLGISIATAATISVISITMGFNQYASGLIFSYYGDYLAVFQMPSYESSKVVSRFTPFSVRDLEPLQRMLPEMEAMSYGTWRQIAVKYNSRSATGEAFISTSSCLEVFHDKITIGKPFSEATFKAMHSPCWIPGNFGEKLNIPDPLIGKTIDVDGQDFTIAGFTDSFDQGQADASLCMLISYPTYSSVFGELKDGEGKLEFRKKADVSMADAKQAVTRAIRRLHGLEPGDADDFRIFCMEGSQDNYTTFITITSSIVFSIAGISLIVGAVGIMNIMLVSVRERTKEIGTRMAAGARRRDIMMQFIVESATLCAIGGALGVAAGQCFAIAVTSVMGMLTEMLGTAYFSPWLIVGSVVFSGLVGMLSGVLPAREAARLDPIEALRHD